MQQLVLFLCTTASLALVIVRVGTAGTRSSGRGVRIVECTGGIFVEDVRLEFSGRCVDDITPFMDVRLTTVHHKCTAVSARDSSSSRTEVVNNIQRQGALERCCTAPSVADVHGRIRRRSIARERSEAAVSSERAARRTQRCSVLRERSNATSSTVRIDGR